MSTAPNSCIRPPLSNRTERYCLIILAVMYVGPVAAMMVWAWSRQTSRSVAGILLTAALVASVIAAITRTWRRFFWVQFPLSAMSAAFIIYAWLFHMPPGHTLAGILAGTSWEEVRGFI